MPRQLLRQSSYQPRCLGIAKHSVQILNRLPGRAFAQIVEAGNDNQTLAWRIQGETNVAEIRRVDVLKLRQPPCRRDPHLPAAGVKLAVKGFGFLRLVPRLEPNVK